MKKSFTLIEILVVIVIIGILSAFIIVSMSGVSQKATIAKGQAFANSLKNALMITWSLNGNSMNWPRLPTAQRLPTPGAEETTAPCPPGTPMTN